MSGFNEVAQQLGGPFINALYGIYASKQPQQQPTQIANDPMQARQMQMQQLQMLMQQLQPQQLSPQQTDPLALLRQLGVL